jgi:formate hydrogenlyase subunit 3/multisubunit Na+/H+ antiporter MnhD subunit
MSGVLIGLGGLVALVAGGALARRVSGEEARWVGAGASLLAILAAAVAALVSLRAGETTVALGPVRLAHDPLAATVMLPVAIALLATSLALPRARMGDGAVARLLWLGAASWAALLADDLVGLLLAEAAGAAIAAASVAVTGRRAAWAYPALAAALALGTLGLALATGAPRGLDHPVGPAVAALAMAFVAVRLGLGPLWTGATSALSSGAPADVAVALLPFGGVATLVKLVHPAVGAGHPVAAAIAITVLATSALAAAAAVIQDRLGRVLALLLSAAHGLLAAGCLVPDEAAFAGAELLWSAVLLAGTGFALSGALTTARFGPLDLRRHHGLHDAAPGLALFFLGTGVALAGIPGTLGFVATDLLLNGTGSLPLGARALAVGVVSLVGFAVLRAFFRAFYGPSGRVRPRVDLLRRERLALLAIAAALVAGGLTPGLAPLALDAAPPAHAPSGAHP